jgi:hypothetical protein
MKRNMAMAGMSVFVLAFALAGCGGITTDDPGSYTFRFKVENNYTEYITKVEFFNGPNANVPILWTVSSMNLGNGQLSNEYTVFGFTDKYGTDERYCGVRVTYDGGAKVFGYGNFGPESKIMVTLYNSWGQVKMSLGKGTW